MSMTKRLLSINALATELGRDRRTIARALSEVSPDGELAGNPAWYLTTALRALGNEPISESNRKMNFLFETMASRAGREDSPAANGPTDFSLDEMARILDENPETVLEWFRIGLPFTQEGDYKTGAGFRTRLSWTVEWTTLLCYAAQSQEERRFISNLGLT